MNAMCAYRLGEAAALAAKHEFPAESDLPVPAWPWWVKAQAAFLAGDLESVRLLIMILHPSCPYCSDERVTQAL